ncbi:MAG: DUF4258 domain-containing protein [Candidatus Aenigmarchaeota archaeon]|nr:DUF4258 domain-containing protein [Candidatus Aenigmarchaeota archaeon]
MDEIISLIKKYSDEIKFKHHAQMRLEQRKISTEEIIKNIQNIEKLLECTKQSDNRYVLVFRQTNKKMLMIVVKVENKTIFVITALSTTKKLSKLVKKWQK